jgi:hypothetical protein
MNSQGRWYVLELLAKWRLTLAGRNLKLPEAGVLEVQLKRCIEHGGTR